MPCERSYQARNHQAASQDASSLLKLPFLIQVAARYLIEASRAAIHAKSYRSSDRSLASRSTDCITLPARSPTRPETAPGARSESFNSNLEFARLTRTSDVRGA